jgi:hypothetical protein
LAHSALPTVHPGSASVLSPYSISTNIVGNEEERRSFHFFRCRTVSEITGYFPSTFWTDLVLQASHFEPAIFHALIALSSVHKDYELNHREYSGVIDYDLQQRHALQQSNKAIGYLRSHLSMAERQSKEVVLIVCLLFICLETFQGNHEAAIAHLDSGMKILNSWLRQDRNLASGVVQASPLNHQVIEEYIIPVFAHLDIQASTYLSTRPVHYDLITKEVDSIDSNVSPPLPKVFTSVNEAHDSLNNQMHWTLHYQQRAMKYFIAATHSNAKLADGVMDMFLEAYREQWHQAHRWLPVFNQFLNKSSSKLNAKELRAALMLKLHHAISIVLLAATLFDYETEFDDYVAEFEKVTSLADSLVKLLSGNSQPSRTPAYSFDSGIVPPLYFTACRCRHPMVRRKALNILEAAPRREGIWDSEVSAAIGRWYVRTEEEGLENICGPQDVPDSVRVHVLDKVLNFGQRRCLIKYRRGIPSAVGKLGVHEEWISW